MTLSDKIVRHRKANGWSQEELAERLYVSRQAVSRWENGSALPDAENILQISKLFNVSADYLLNDGCEKDGDISAGDPVEKEKDTAALIKRRLHLIAGTASVVAAVFFAAEAVSACFYANVAAGAAYGAVAVLCTFNTVIQFALYFKKR